MSVFLALTFFSSVALAFPEATPSYTDINSVQAERTMVKICARSAYSLSDAEGVDWVKARIALVALYRLQGKEEAALEVFAGCESFCDKWGSEEWKALRSWGCAKQKTLKLCRKR